MKVNEDFIHMPIPRSMFVAVCALLGGVSTAAVATAAPRTNGHENTAPPANLVPVEAESTQGVTEIPADDGTIDAAGWPWSAELHASTRGMTKDGLWRMKVGVSRPDPKPGFPKAEGNGATGTPSDGAGSAPSASALVAAATSTEDEDEFAAFRAAADKANGTDAAAAASIPARKWTDADLGAICNQAAVKLGDPAPIKALIAEYVPEGQVPHSRNIPDEKRDAFAKAVEAKAGIEFAG